MSGYNPTLNISHRQMASDPAGQTWMAAYAEQQQAVLCGDERMELE
jgi:hypothetical protein